MLPIISRMRLPKKTLFLTTVLGTVLSLVHGVVRNDDLLVRWTFDEGNGTIAHDATGNGVDATIYGGGQWGSGISGNALDLTGNSGWAEAGPHVNLKVLPAVFPAQQNHTIALWFKSAATQQDWTQLLSKRENISSPYFVQFDQGGNSAKVYYRFQASYLDGGSFSVSHGSWNHLVATYDGNKFKTYLNGLTIGSIDEMRNIDQDNGKLGIGGTPDGGDVFNGLIDDVRLYNVPLSLEEVTVAYGDGMGDFGPKVEINATLATHVSPIPVYLTFRDETGTDVNVTGLQLSDFELRGASAQNLVEVNASHYQMELVPDRNQTFVFLTVPTGSAQDANLDNSIRATHRINFNYKVTRVADLVGWWTFDETSGNIAADTSGGDANATVFGGAAWAGANAKFGTGALVLDGTDDYAIANALITPDRITRAADLIGHWPFDETSGTATVNLGTSGTAQNAMLTNGATFSTTEKRFGNASLQLPQGNTGARVQVNTPLSLGATNSESFSIAAWFKKLYPHNGSSWRTLSRGSAAGHHMMVGNNNDNVGVFANTNGDWRDSGEFDMQPGNFQDAWHHIVVEIPIDQRATTSQQSAIIPAVVKGSPSS
jgi:hypothetical protein